MPLIIELTLTDTTGMRGCNHLKSYFSTSQDGTRTTHAGHCAAALMGVLAYARIKKGYRRPLRPPE